MIFTPRWKKEAKNIYKAGRKFLHFKRDLLSDDRIKEIESRLSDVKSAMKGRGEAAKEATQEAVHQLDNTCEQALPKQKKPDAIGENIESLFVALVIAIGIRSYYAQPFIIPTGSMQPTLNGVICDTVDKENWPNLATRGGQMVLRGRTYVHKVAKEDLIIPHDLDSMFKQNPGAFRLVQTFHRVTQLKFENKTLMAHGLPMSELGPRGEFNILALAENRNGRGVIPKGTVLYSGYADSGDVIIANKVAYHFRKPKRGEPFIFDTRGINTNNQPANLASQQDATHYIKRLVGVPGDTLSISPPNLIVNGNPAEEKYIKRVMKAEDFYDGYQLGERQADEFGRMGPRPYIYTPEDVMELSDSDRKPWMAEYAAMGDNTGSSLDSRYWGSVREYNVVAPATFTLWPFTTGHWGFIK